MSLTLASHSPDALLQPDVIGSVEESILQAFDLAMDAASPRSEGKRLSLSHYLSLVRKFDEFVAANAGKTVYSADVARQLGVSVRTLHNAVVADSRHEHAPLHAPAAAVERASATCTGVSLQSIKAVALVNGFWHMGEFTSLYRDLFGETPQQTLSAARNGRAVSRDVGEAKAAISVVLPFVVLPISLHRLLSCKLTVVWKLWRHECRSWLRRRRSPFVRNERLVQSSGPALL